MLRIDALLLEFGLSLLTGHKTMKELFFWFGKQKGSSLPEVFLLELQVAHDHYLYLNEHVAQQDKKIKQWVKQNSLC
jgi:hemerythrin